MYTYKIGISAQEHDDFVKQSSQTNLLQSASWAKVKDNWDNERIGFYKNNQLVASASILIKPLPLSMTMLYIPRGPIMDYQDQELLHFVLTSLKKFAKTKKALFIKFDPSLFLVQNQSGEERQDNPKTLDLINNLQKQVLSGLDALNYWMKPFSHAFKQIFTRIISARNFYRKAHDKLFALLATKVFKSNLVVQSFWTISLL